MAPDGAKIILRWPKNEPKMAREGPKLVPDEPKMMGRSPQDDLKRPDIKMLALTPT